MLNPFKKQKKAKEKTPIIVGPTVEDTDATGGPLPGSIKRACKECGTDVYITQVDLDKVTKDYGPPEFACLKCCIAHMTDKTKIGLANTENLPEGLTEEILPLLERILKKTASERRKKEEEDAEFRARTIEHMKRGGIKFSDDGKTAKDMAIAFAKATLKTIEDSECPPGMDIPMEEHPELVSRGAFRYVLLHMLKHQLKMGPTSAAKELRFIASVVEHIDEESNNPGLDKW